MEILSNNLQVKVDLRYFSRKWSPSKRHTKNLQVNLCRNWSPKSDPPLKIKTPNPEFLVRRLFSESKNINSSDHEATYFCALSEKSQNFHLPFVSEIPEFVHRYDVGGSCGGWMCLCCSDYYHTHNILLWNPSTNEYHFLPPSDVPRPSCCSYPMLDNCTYEMAYYFCHGFGFNSKSGDLKVVRFVHHLFEGKVEEMVSSYCGCECQVELYSRRANCWKQLPYPDLYPSDPHSVYINGIVYWRGVEGITSFDFDNESFSYLDYPQNVGKYLRKSYGFKLVNCGGSIGFVVYPFLGIDKWFQVWVSNGGWMRKLDVRVPGAERPLGFSNDGRLFYFESIYRQLLVHDLTTGETTNHPNPNIRDYPEIISLFLSHSHM